MNSRFLPALVASTLLAATAFAGSEAKSVIEKNPVEPCPPVTRDWLTLQSSYTGESDFERGHDAKGDSFFKRAELNHRIPLNLAGGWPHNECGQWYLRVGADYERWDFDNEGGLPLPNHLQSFAAVIALEYVVRDAVAINIEARPGFYFENDVRGNTFNVPVIAYAPLWWHEGDQLSWALIGGVAYDPIRSYPIIPAVGLSAKYGKWTLLALPPQPRLVYAATNELSLWAEGELAGGSFRTDHHDFERKESLNNAVVTYSEWRVSGGITWKPCANALVDLGGGYAFKRKFDFHRAEEGFSTDGGAPFVKIEVRASF